MGFHWKSRVRLQRGILPDCSHATPQAAWHPRPAAVIAQSQTFQIIRSTKTFTTRGEWMIPTIKDVAAHAVRDALERDAPHDLETLIKAALQRCRTS